MRHASPPSSVLPPGPPAAHGLYDPAHEHDACGVGFVVDIKGRRSHAIVRQALQVLKNLAHRGACGCEVNTGDGAGILVQMPDTFLRKVAPGAAAAGRASTASGSCSCRATRQHRAGRRAARSPHRRRGGPAAARLARRADRRQRRSARARSPSSRSSGRCSSAAADPAGGSGARRRTSAGRGRGGGSSASCTSSASGSSTRSTRCAIPDASRKLFYIVSLSSQHADLQGHADGRPDRADVPRSGRSGPRVGAGAGPPAVQHQHVPVVAAGASVPLHRAQRRDQHADAATSTGCARARGCSASDVLGDDLKKILPVIREGGSDTATFDNVLEFLVMTGRSLPHAILMMIPEPWQNHDEHVARAQGVLRVPLVADGAVGRPGVDRVHRRHGHRRGARPQRPAAVALLRDQGRPGDHGVRGRRARHPAREHRAQGAAAPGPDLPGRHGAGPHRVGRGDQARAGRGAAVPASGCRT